MPGHDDQLTVFLREIKDRPEDDVPRLVLADWLQDQGDPRGEFIHLQVMRHRLPADDPAALALYREELALLRRHSLDWLGPLADLASAWRFSRGFVWLEVRGEALPQCQPAAPDWAEALRWVEAVRLRCTRPFDPELLSRAGLLQQVHRLDLAGVPLRALGPLLRPEAAGLRALVLRGSGLGDAEAKQLADAAALAGLRGLDLSENPRLHDPGAYALARSPHLRGLTSLDVRGNGISFTGHGALVSAFRDRVLLPRGG